MSTSHTPGPWTIGKVDHTEQHVDIDSLNHDPFVGCDEWRSMARTYGTEGDEEKGSVVMLANARLIAAAPELLEVARMAELFANGEALPTREQLATAARAAIAKATGEQK